MGGSLEYSEIENIYTKFPEYKNLIKIFVETGTYKGQTARMASKYFSKVFTFEISQELFKESVQEGEKQGCNNISYFLGDSVELLKGLMPLLNVPSLYFIDAHISGSDSSYNGKQLVPLMEELDIILSTNKGNNIFIIDDARFWTGENKPDDWKHISINSVLEKFRKNDIEVKSHWLANDRYIIVV